MLRILYVSSIIPYPPTDGGRIRGYNLIKYLAKENEITLIAFFKENNELKYIPALKEFCKDIYPVLSWTEQRRNPLSRKLSLRSYSTNRMMLDQVNSVLQKQQFDLIQVNALWMSQFLPKNFEGIRVLDSIDVQSIRYKMFVDVREGKFNKMIAFLKWLIVKNIERNVGKKADIILTVSSFDRDALMKITKRDHIYAIPNGVDINYFKPSFNQKRSGADLLFIGAMDYLPNSDAMLYFCREIFPIIKSHMSDVKLHIIGKNPPTEILQLEEIDGVEVGGHDQSKEIFAAGGYIDIRPYYDKCSVFVVPLRIGSGTRYKILDTLSKGKPIVSTSIGCQGIEVTDGMNIIIRDKPHDFAEATVNLLNDKNLQEKLIKNGRKLITEKYDWNVIGSNLSTIYKEALNS